MPPSDYNGSFWQRTETEYFLDYERRALNTSLDTDHVDVDVNSEQEEHEDLDSEDLLLPWSCCVSHFLAQQEEKERQLNEPEALANTIRGRLLAKSKADKKDPKDPILPFGIRKVQFHTLRKKVGKEYNLEEPIWETEKWCIFSPSEGALWHYHQGCSEPLKAWINSSGDTLFVIGFCVIAFLKLTFLGILHYEIKEMIQKIQNLQKETQQMNGDLLRLGTLTSNSPVIEDQVSKPGVSASRPTELPRPVHTLVTSSSGTQGTTVTTAQSDHTSRHSGKSSPNNANNHNQILF